MERPQVRTGKPIRQTLVKPKLLLGVVPFIPGSLVFVLVAWLCLVPGVYVSIPVGGIVVFCMWIATMHDAFWSEIGMQKFLSACRRMVRTRGRTLFSPRRKYKAAR